VTLKKLTLANPLKRMIRNSSATRTAILVAGSFNFIIRFLATTSKASPGVKRPTFTPFQHQKIMPKIRVKQKRNKQGKKMFIK